MKKTLLTGALVTVAMLFPVDALRALGLGEARVDSYLGQPLDVTIRLIEADMETLEAMTVSPARAEDYERLGVPAEALAYDLDISLDRSNDPALIRVRSRRAVNDPVIRFLVDARWSSGRVLREYTLFLDPPTIDVAPPAPAVRRETRRPEPVVTERVEPAREPAPERRRPAPPVEQSRPEEPSVAETPLPVETPAEPERVESPTRPVPSLPTEIEVGAGQTLWGIAAQWRPSERLTMNQVMLAIFDRNPAAFDDNVNRLLRGARLSLPSIEAVESLSAAEADRRIRQQMQAWREQRGQTEVPTIAESAVPETEPEPVVDVEETPAGDDVVHRLDVIPPESDIFDEGPVVSEGEIRRASSRVAELEDEMYAEALENDEFVRRITSIREAIDSRDVAGLAVADEELAEFEARLRAAREAREESERLAAELAAEESAADAEDEVGSYFRQLEEEMADAGSADNADEQAADPLAGTPQDSAADSAPSAVAEVDADGAGDEPLAEPAVMPEATIGRSSEGPSWPWLLIGLAALLAVGGAVALFLLLRRRGQTDSAPLAATGAGMTVSAARERVQANPEDLGAHLALLAALGDRDDPDGFSAALDDMYRQVDDEDEPQWQEALNMAVVHAPDHPLLTPNETGLATDDDDEGLDDRTREMLGILPSSDEPETMAVEPDDYEFDSELEADRADPDDIFSTESESYSPASDQDTVRTSPLTEADGEDIDGDDPDLAELSRRLDKPEEDQPPVDVDDDEDDTDLTLGSETDKDESTQILPSAPVVDQPDSDDLDDDLAADDPLRLDFEFSDRSSSTDNGRDQTLPLSDEFDLSVEAEDSSEDDLDTDELGADLAAEDDDLVDLDAGDDRRQGREESPDEIGDREMEAFLSQDEGAADEGEPELSDEDAEVKLDLARAYLSMDDPDSARTLLEEITSGGSAAMRAEARKLLDQD